MNKYIAVFVTAMGMIVAPFLTQDAEAFRLGLGANYWKTISDIDLDGDFDEDGLSFVLSGQFELTDLTRVELAVEVFDEGFAGVTDERIYQPQAFLLLGSTIYAGAGVGMTYVDGDFMDDPFFAFRAGLDLELLPNIHLDIFANYRFESWDDVTNENGQNQDISEDTVTLGAAARIEI